MNILNKLTIKHLKMNKKRTLVTIIGIILSTALMVGIGLLVSSMLTTERMAMTKNYGSHHAYIENLTKSEYDTVSRNVNVKNTYYYTPLGYVKVESGLSSKPYLYVVEGSKELINNLKLVSGSLPTNSNEIVISEELTHFIDDYKVGDTVSFDLGVRISEGEELGIYHNYSVPMSWEEDVPKYIDEEFKVSETKTYKIVGIVERTSYEEYNAAGFMTFSLNSSKADIYNTYIEYKNPSKSYKYTEEIVSNVGLTDKAVKMNENLLYYYGATKYNNVNSTLLPLMIIALSVISVGCIIVIYNSFAISTMERKKSFGLYASIGTTPKQIKKTVLFEATLVGTIGIFLGVLGGFLGIYVVVQIINYLVADSLSMKILFSVDALYIIIPLIFMVAVILISAYLPAKRSSLVTPIEAIRGNDDIKIAKKDVKTPKYITKLFGIEGTIAHKNIKRNKKKYRVTIISLFISIVMFNTFTSFLNYFVKASDSFDYYDYDIQVVFYNDIDTAYSDINMLTNKYKTDKSLIIVNQDVLSVTNMKADDFTTQYQSIYLDDREEQDAGIGFGLIVLKDEDFRKITNKEAILLNNKYYT
ncbi:MAG: ABC transporter permease, partial [Bacilli bacterium]|nr:ABC transporter permease [Bacilli bacterium]